MKKLITDKTLAAFEKWFYENHGKCSKKFEELLTWEKSEIMDYLFNACETIQHAFLIEFFDSVGYLNHNTNITSIIRFNIYKRSTLNEVYKISIEEANEIFNNR